MQNYLDEKQEYQRHIHKSKIERRTACLVENVSKDCGGIPCIVVSLFAGEVDAARWLKLRQSSELPRLESAVFGSLVSLATGTKIHSALSPSHLLHGATLSLFSHYTAERSAGTSKVSPVMKITNFEFTGSTPSAGHVRASFGFFRVIGHVEERWER